MAREDVLSQIAELLEEQEAAIAEHPPETGAVYAKGRSAFIEGQSDATDTEWSHSVGLSLEELSLIHRCMLSSSFISAWYHLAGDTTRRDQLASSCSLLVAGVGLDAEDVMRRYIQYEQLWRGAMRHEGLTPRRIPGMLVVAVCIIALLLLWYWLD